MFTGIIETTGTVVSLEKVDTNICIEVKSLISEQLKVDQSVSHNGVCLTVTEVNLGIHKVVAVRETLKRSSLSNLTVGSVVNLERAMLADGRFDGHLVQGHVDQTARCTNVEDQNGSWKFWFRFQPTNKNLLVEKGSVCIDGVSLTLVDVEADLFSVVIIPYTFENTCFSTLKVDDLVNLEFDIIGKYVAKAVIGS